ncbi:SusC/RagA family TonB-linked outer membrane protein [Mucilaginibacter ginsenosidivorax]|uniref:TonB-dependent receptor n=1 Tax=Mucilaginibacter ginsenosidivorax TaxID=862126 RepID=A0A5B8W7G8_9SPHI|nr:TonB-dependent receptor [Mucilaginibacter ginsenosidivorax]QEC78895.1 TonB-dependent receptor [Mucilaginibacter ginsenosidivorax]
MRKLLHVLDGGPPLKRGRQKMISSKKFIVALWTILIAVTIITRATAQTGNVAGTVRDENGQTLPGVTVSIKGTAIGTNTDNAGHFVLNKVQHDAVLVFSFVGYSNQEIHLNGKTTISISLFPMDKKLNEVIVVGYGTQKKSDVTGSVSGISPKDYKDQPVNRLDQVLQGRVSGVQVSNNSGAPGGDVTIRIRGSNSILGNNNPLYVIDGYVGADFNTLNPDDIESIQVLKDASGTALYGSRGANGVVLVTTKKGDANKIQIGFSSALSSSAVIKKFPMLNAYDFANTVNERDIATNVKPTFTAAQLSAFKANGGTNWQDLIYKRAFGQQYDLSLTGGNASTNYFISTNYLNQQGTVVNSGYKKYALRSNINSKVSDKLTVRFYITGDRRENLNTNISGKNSPEEQAIAWAPTTPARDASGNFTATDPVGSIFQNPLALAYDQTNKDLNTHANIIAGANYHFTKDLSLDELGGIDYLNYQNQNYVGQSINAGVATAGRQSIESTNLQTTTALNYNHDFKGRHHLDATGVFEVQRNTANGFSAAASGLTFPNLTFYNLSLASNFSTNANYAQSTIVSLIGRVNYSYADKYLLTAAIRRDGSSKFQGNNQESIFPSVAVGWKISSEDFIKNLNLFNELKLRASWGKTGSQAISPYATLATYLSDNYNAGSSFTSSSITPGIVLGNAANPSLKWETTKQKDIGIDAGILEGRINISADYYIKNTSNLLLALPLPAYAGGGTIISNVGSVRNTGVDLSLNATAIRTTKFSWTTTFNVSFLKNRVENIGDQPQIFPVGNVGSGLSPQPEFVVKPGYSLGSYWGVTYLGTWKPDQVAEAAKFGAKPGDSRYLTASGSTSPVYGIIGNGLPKQSLGWNNTFTYKNLSMNVFVESLLGFDKLDYTYAASITANSDAREATNPDILKRYKPGVNESSNIPAFSTTNSNLFVSSRFMEKGDFVRVKNVNLSYTFPKKTIKNVYLKVFVGAINLFTITKYKGIDPEAANSTSGSDVSQGIDYGTYPNSKIFNAGLNLKF